MRVGPLPDWMSTHEMGYDSVQSWDGIDSLTEMFTAGVGKHAPLAAVRRRMRADHDVTITSRSFEIV